MIGNSAAPIAPEFEKTAINSRISPLAKNEQEEKQQKLIADCRKKIFAVIFGARQKDIYKDPDIAIWESVLDEMSEHPDLRQFRELADMHVLNAVIGAHKSNQEFFGLLSEAKKSGRIGLDESIELFMDFISNEHNQGERDEMKKDLQKTLEEHEETFTEFHSLVKHELIDNADEHLKEFKNTEVDEREELLKELQATIAERNLARFEIKKETDASKKLCESKNWKEALIHCENALEMIQEVDGADEVVWFSHRAKVVAKVIHDLEKKISQEDLQGESNQEIIVLPQDEEEIGKNIEEERPEILSSERKAELQRILVKWFLQSKRASAATIKAFVHATDAININHHRAELQNEVDVKDNLLIEDHEEEQDRVLCVEADSSRMQHDKVLHMAYDDQINQKTIAFVDSDERVLSLEESDTSIARDLRTVLLDGITQTNMSADEREYCRSLVLNLLGTNYYAKLLRGETEIGLEKYESSLGENFRRNENWFAEDLVEDAFATEKVAASA